MQKKMPMLRDLRTFSKWVEYNKLVSSAKSNKRIDQRRKSFCRVKFSSLRSGFFRPETFSEELRGRVQHLNPGILLRVEREKKNVRAGESPIRRKTSFVLSLVLP